MGDRIQDRKGFNVLGLLSDKDEAQFGRVDGSRADLSGRFSMAVMRGRGILAGQIRSYNTVSAATLECRPPISGIRNMDMKERNNRNPGD